MWSWLRVEAPFLQELLVVIDFSFHRIQVMMTHLCYNMELEELDQVTMVVWPGGGRVIVVKFLQPNFT